MAATAFLFPGQGAQDPSSIDLVRAHAPDLHDLACALAGDDPLARCEESTRWAQPAIVLASLAGWRARAGDDVAVGFAGHSLGELSALAAAGALSETDAVRLAVLRGALMADAADAAGDGGMLAVLKGTAEDAEALAAEHGLVVANDNAPGQAVLAGPRGALDAARRGAREHGLRAIELDVAGAFHTPAMEPARAPFAAAAREVAWSSPAAPVVSGLTARPFTDPPAELSAAITAPVRWREVMGALAALWPERYADVGPGEVLARLARRNAGEVAHVVAAGA